MNSFHNVNNFFVFFKEQGGLFSHLNSLKFELENIFVNDNLSCIGMKSSKRQSKRLSLNNQESPTTQLFSNSKAIFAVSKFTANFRAELLPIGIRYKNYFDFLATETQIAMPNPEAGGLSQRATKWA